MKVKIKETGEIFELRYDLLEERAIIDIIDKRGDFANGSFVGNNDGTFTCDQKTFVLYNDIFEELDFTNMIIGLLRENGLDDIADIACEKVNKLPFNSFSFEDLHFEYDVEDEESLRETFGENVGTLDKFFVGGVRRREFSDIERLVNDELLKKGLILGPASFDEDGFVDKYAILKREL